MNLVFLNEHTLITLSGSRISDFGWYKVDGLSHSGVIPPHPFGSHVLYCETRWEVEWVA